MRSVKFFVGREPYAVWDLDIQEKNIRFLKGFDVGYFEYLAKVHSDQIVDGNAQHAAIAIRTSYGLALETFFSLVGATLQAPECVFGWLYKYKKGDLSLLINTIRGTEQLRTRFASRLSWDALSSLIHLNLVLSDKDREGQIKARYAKCWEYLAQNYQDPEIRTEFNSIKHGLRLQPGGFRAAFGLQEQPGVPAPPERMTSMGGSDYGSSILKLVRIGGLEHDYRILEDLKNWDLRCLIGRLRVISMSIGNVISFLLIQNGQNPTSSRFVWPEDLEDFDKIWEPHFRLSGSTFGLNIDVHKIAPTRSEDVEKNYPDRKSRV